MLSQLKLMMKNITELEIKTDIAALAGQYLDLESQRKHINH